MGFDKSPLLRINTSDTISKDALTPKKSGLDLSQRACIAPRVQMIVSLVRSRVLLFEQMEQVI